MDGWAVLGFFLLVAQRLAFLLFAFGLVWLLLLTFHLWLSMLGQFTSFVVSPWPHAQVEKCSRFETSGPRA